MPSVYNIEEEKKGGGGTVRSSALKTEDLNNDKQYENNKVLNLPLKTLIKKERKTI